MLRSRLVILLLVALQCAVGEDYEKSISMNGVDNLFPDKGLTDAHSIIVDSTLYLFCGHDKSWDTEDTWVMDRWEIWSSKNLVEWKKENEIYPSDTYIGNLPNCFAGDIISRDGKYYWYFSNRSINTGVMVADTPIGPYKDALGKPLLSEGIIGKLHPYDPEVYEEDGVYSIIFGAGHYHIATLAEDMISLDDDPKPIKVLNDKGEDMWTADKACVFKRKGKYYLIWEHKYAMSDNLQGPYSYIGESLQGGHCNVFEWEGQYYALLENKDISLFYRGVSLKPLNFNDDGTIIIPQDDSNYPANGRAWDFKHSRMGWRATEGTTLVWDDSGKITGVINGNSAIESSTWLLTDLSKYKTLVIRLKNTSEAVKAKVCIASFDFERNFWQKPKVEWNVQPYVSIDIEPSDAEFHTYSISLEEITDLRSKLKKLRIEPACGVEKGTWEIDYIGIE